MNSLGYDRVEALNAVLIAAALAIPAMLFWGRVSDRIGRKKVFIGGATAVAVYTLPFLWMMNQKTFGWLLLALVIGFSVIWASYGSVIGTFFAKSFPADVRYTGASLGYQVGAAIAGVAVLIASWALISILAVAFATDRSGQRLDD